MGDLKFFEWALGAISALLGLLYLGNNRRLDRIEETIAKQLPSDFERAELTRQRVRSEDSIRRIFETLDEMKDRATSRHLEILGKIDEKADKP